MSEIAKLIEAAAAARANAYAPYSRFAVGAAIRAEDGSLHVGANVENAAYPQGQCAEASAIGAMIAAGRRRIGVTLGELLPFAFGPDNLAAGSGR